MPVFVVGFILGASVAAAASIIFPTKRVRQERPLDDETETRILLGLPLDEPGSPAELADHRDFGREELDALRGLDAEERGPTSAT